MPRQDAESCYIVAMNLLRSLTDIYCSKVAAPAPVNGLDLNGFWALRESIP
jgi:hypothetical protein